MYEPLRKILDIQKLDMKMIRLMKLKKARKREFEETSKARDEMDVRLGEKLEELRAISDECTLYEQKIEENRKKIKALEEKQPLIKKIEEFNAVTKEVTTLEREIVSWEQSLVVLTDKKNLEEESYKSSKKTLEESDIKCREIQNEIKEMISQINKEGAVLQKKRDAEVATVDQEIFGIYERLLYSKKDRVVVPLEDRVCSGCNISLTAQHENIVRKGDKLVFCEHCSRIHFWPESFEEKKVTRRAVRYISG